jgi:hypothetical protein
MVETKQHGERDTAQNTPVLVSIKRGGNAPDPIIWDARQASRYGKPIIGSRQPDFR